MRDIRFTLKGANCESSFALSVGRNGEKFLLCDDGNDERILNITQQDNGDTWRLCDEDYTKIEEDRAIVDERLLGLQAEWLECVSQGFEVESGEVVSDFTVNDLRTDDIFVELKPFSLRQIEDLIETKDLELAPSFQRNFIWDKTRQSRLIESIFLGLPLPACYLSQYRDGVLTVVDGLQRLRTIHRFMTGNLRLSNLEYLRDCEGKTYDELKVCLSPLKIRRFAQTQLTCFVIDYRSPSRLKYDLFRRLNVGGKPLNAQEIRNCLSREPLQKALHAMVNSEEFLLATTGSVRNERMDAQEAALRFIYFYDQYSQENPIGNYDGNMDFTLNELVEALNKTENLMRYVEEYKYAMKTAYHLFGNMSFRKEKGGIPGKRGPINKALLMTVAVLLAKNRDKYEMPEDECFLKQPMANLIATNDRFFKAITLSTNSKANIRTVFEILETELFSKYLKCHGKDTVQYIRL